MPYWLYPVPVATTCLFLILNLRLQLRVVEGLLILKVYRYQESSTGNIGWIQSIGFGRCFVSTVKENPYLQLYRTSKEAPNLFIRIRVQQFAGSVCIKNLKLTNIQFVVNSFYPKKWKGIFFWHNWLANLHGFANICKLPVSNTFKDMQLKI